MMRHWSSTQWDSCNPHNSCSQTKCDAPSATNQRNNYHISECVPTSVYICRLCLLTKYWKLENTNCSIFAVFHSILAFVPQPQCLQFLSGNITTLKKVFLKRMKRSIIIKTMKGKKQIGKFQTIIKTNSLWPGNTFLYLPLNANLSWWYLTNLITVMISIYCKLIPSICKNWNKCLTKVKHVFVSFPKVWVEADYRYDLNILCTDPINALASLRFCHLLRCAPVELWGRQHPHIMLCASEFRSNFRISTQVQNFDQIHQTLYILFCAAKLLMFILVLVWLHI